MMGKQIGDVDVTYANMKKSEIELNFIPRTSFNSGINQFINWYSKYTKN